MKILTIILIHLTVVNSQLFLPPDIILQYLSTILQTSVNSKCVETLQLLLDDSKTNQDWALRMLDATAKPQSGLLEGNIMHVGAYDECLEINVERQERTINGQYCSIIYKLGNASDLSAIGQTEQSVDDEMAETRFSWGVCIPKVCTVEDLRSLWENAKEKFAIANLELKFLDKYCDYNGKSDPYSPMTIFAIVFFVGIISMAILSTLFDLVSVKRTGTKHLLLTSFSLYSNGIKLFSTKQGSENLGCLNGLRVISMMWILLAHRFMYTFFTPSTNILRIVDWKSNVENVVILGANMAVDTFFTVSGLLLMYVFARAAENGNRFNYITFVVHRYLRLTPALAAVVLFSATLVKYLGHGPFWPVVYDSFQRNCETNWWSTLLYVQNYVHPDNICVGQSWYLAVDTQLYVLAPLLLLPIIRSPKPTIIAIVFLISGCTIANFVVTWVKRFGSVYFDENAEQFKYLFGPTHMRMGPWLIGFLAGYVIHRTRNVHLQLSKPNVFFLWALSLGVLIAVVVGTNAFTEGEYDVVQSSFYNAATKPAWAFAVCTVVFLCVHGYGGIINRMLSASIFTVLIRINYSMYLVHMLVLVYLTAQKRQPEFITNTIMYHNFWGDFVYTVVLSIMLTLVCESPVIVFEKLIFGPNKSGKKYPETTLNGIKIDDNGNKETANC